MKQTEEATLIDTSEVSMISRLGQSRLLKRLAGLAKQLPFPDKSVRVSRLADRSNIYEWISALRRCRPIHYTETRR